MALAVIALLGWYMLSFRGADDATRHRVRMTFAAVLVAQELTWHAWAYHYVGWTLDKMLPLHLCTVLLWVGAYTLVTLDTFAYEFLYFMGIGGPLQALLTPDAGVYGLPHFRAVQTMLSHGGILIVALYLTLVEGMRPTWRSVPRVIFGTLAYMAVVTVINVLVGGNYMFTLHKPETKSILDAFGPWPWYLLPMIAAGITNVLLLYLPFWWADRRRAGTAVTASAATP